MFPQLCVFIEIHDGEAWSSSSDSKSPWAMYWFTFLGINESVHTLHVHTSFRSFVPILGSIFTKVVQKNALLSGYNVEMLCNRRLLVYAFILTQKIFNIHKLVVLFKELLNISDNLKCTLVVTTDLPTGQFLTSIKAFISFTTSRVSPVTTFILPSAIENVVTSEPVLLLYHRRNILLEVSHPVETASGLARLMQKSRHHVRRIKNITNFDAIHY